MSVKSHLWFYATCVLLPIASLLTFVVIRDPLQLFHANSSGNWHGNFRWQLAGIVRHYSDTFDSVIIGTSVAENSSADEATRLFGERFANLSVTASDFFERHVFLSFLLKRKPLKTVIYSLDNVYHTRTQGYTVFPLQSWMFLYDDNHFNDVQLYLNPPFLPCMFVHHVACDGKHTTLDRPNEWASQPSQSRRFGGFENWLKAKDDGQVSYDLKLLVGFAKMIREHQRVPLQNIQQETQLARQYVDNYVLSLVKAYPKTQFTLFFPPYSRLRLAVWYQIDETRAQSHQDIVRYLTAASEALPNLAVYGFEDQSFLDDISNYKDLVHYHPRINSLIHRQIHQGHGRLTSANVDAYLQAAREKALKVDFVRIAERIVPSAKAADSP